MYENKTTLLLLRNIDWRTIKVETEKIYDSLIHISTKKITELNELIYAGAKLVCEKIGFSQKKHKQKLKTWMGNSTRNAEKKSSTCKNDKTKKNAGTC